MQIQQNMIQGLLSLGEDVFTVLFTDDEYYQDLCDHPSSRFRCQREFKANKYHMPYIQSIFDSLEKLPFDCSFYGYVNGDIVLSPSIVSVLQTVKENIHNNRLKSRAMVVGRRTNIPWSSVPSLPSNHSYSGFLSQLCSTDSPYMSNAVVQNSSRFLPLGLFLVYKRNLSCFTNERFCCGSNSD